MPGRGSSKIAIPDERLPDLCRLVLMGKSISKIAKSWGKSKTVVAMAVQRAKNGGYMDQVKSNEKVDYFAPSVSPFDNRRPPVVSLPHVPPHLTIPE